jgi:microcystin-dependent protein
MATATGYLIGTSAASPIVYTNNVIVTGNISSGNISTTGSVTANNFIISGGSLLIPTGVIVIWSGSIATIPGGWALCDGTNGTIDLRSKFVYGAGILPVGNIGGSETHTLTIDEMPTHNHTYNEPNGGKGHQHSLNVTDSGGSGALDDAGGSGTSYTQYAKTDITINYTGNNWAHNNMPPYYALAYIMKL